MASIKRLAVISTATSVRKKELLTLRQDHGQPIRSFAARVKGKAQVCAFSKQCTADGCDQIVDYTEDIVKYVVISGIVDEDIKKDVLGHADLDTRSLNDTISLIENKEMAVRAMTTGISADMTTAVNQTKSKSSRDVQTKLSLKKKCQNCDKLMPKFILRKGKLKEFNICIDCWKDQHGKKNNTTGALFDIIGGISTDQPTKKPTTNAKLPNKSVLLDHYIFDGTYGWMVKESRKQPYFNLKIFTRKSDHDHINLPCPNVRSTKVSAVTDTGAQSSLMGLKTFRKCGFSVSDLVPVKKKMYAANNEGINILGAVFARLSGNDENGSRLETAEMIYVSDTTNLLVAFVIYMDLSLGFVCT